MFVKKQKILSLILLATPIWAFSNIEIQQFDNPRQESTYRALIAELRCPQCQNNNIADSNATIATDMRHKTLELLKQGKTKDEVVNYMVERYGNFVTYDPPVTPATIFLWALPVVLILLGFGIVLSRKKRNQAGKKGQESTNITFDKQRLNEILNKDNE